MVTQEDLDGLEPYIVTRSFLEELLEWYGEAESEQEKQILEVVMDVACFYLSEGVWANE